MEWEYRFEMVRLGENRYAILREMGKIGWEAWHIDEPKEGWREIYFKRPKS